MELRTRAESSSLAFWAVRYLAAEVWGVQSKHTLDAKGRDLHAFIAWFVDVNGHADIAGWMPRDTKRFLEHRGRAPTTINRALATLRRFARWVHDQQDSPFEHGLPTRSIKELTVDEPDAKKLSTREIHQLFKAADALVATETRKDARPRRNRAILAVLFHTGLRVSELCGLQLEQYRDRYLHNVRRKGKNRTKELYVAAECRRALEDYLANERVLDDPELARAPLFLSTRGAGHLTRRQIARILDHIAQEAKTGSDTETAAALGHASYKYVGRYVRKTREEREQVLDSIGP